MKNAAISGGTATITTATGLSQMIDMIPSDIGKVACLFGILASTGVICAQCINIWVMIKNSKKLEIEIKNMENK